MYEELKAAKGKQNRDKQINKHGSGNEAKLKQVTLAEMNEL